jgi:hypothetical protein
MASVKSSGVRPMPSTSRDNRVADAPPLSVITKVFPDGQSCGYSAVRARAAYAAWCRLEHQRGGSQRPSPHPGSAATITSLRPALTCAGGFAFHPLSVP